MYAYLLSNSRYMKTKYLYFIACPCIEPSKKMHKYTNSNTMCTTGLELEITRRIRSYPMRGTKSNSRYESKV